MSKTLNSKILAEFLKRAGERLEGEWLLVGGTLLPAVGIDVRSTVDIDFLGLGKNEGGHALELMEIAESLGLSVETVNQAASFFLKKAGYDRSDLIVLFKGSAATIFRPSLLLYFKLKLARFTETDQVDCEHYCKFCRQVGDPFEKSKLTEVLTSAEAGTDVSAEKRNRIRELRETILST